MHLTTTRLVLREHHLMPETLENRHRRPPRLGEQRVPETGDEQTDAHSVATITLTASSLHRAGVALTPTPVGEAMFHVWGFDRVGVVAGDLFFLDPEQKPGAGGG